MAGGGLSRMWSAAPGRCCPQAHVDGKAQEDGTRQPKCWRRSAAARSGVPHARAGAQNPLTLLFGARLRLRHASVEGGAVHVGRRRTRSNRATGCRRCATPLAHDAILPWHKVAGATLSRNCRPANPLGQLAPLSRWLCTVAPDLCCPLRVSLEGRQSLSRIASRGIWRVWIPSEAARGKSRNETQPPKCGA
jgi:hypothetical protein